MQLQRVLPTAIVTFVGVWVCWLSYTQEPAAAYLFPRIISTVFVALSLWSLGRALLGLSQSGDGLSAEMMKAIGPGLLIVLVYIFLLLRTLGFYSASAVAVLAVLTVYDGASHLQVMTWVKRLIISAAFTAAMYLIFGIALKVFTPNGLII
ncbi:conserved membrane protein of unknown function [Candidatus Filomicrobium marinum]|uniref:DUF1468 domain-containing protein n=1 Tax=Candidatus Filomicrobium marinum TaxID=1608628 RepID=A0A0D6JEG7_9HYPH|nr:tripartite tricarboxylate transporter TctB family protein [Candidatus Filomicrobium marinum]CFX16336.1 conserved membrane protein of unknown function [Candidatus Filomicrobium marinum]CPR18084.1 conserved membrane protein of unknown function [Candidatus Filomicrobium marinum]